MLPCLIRTRPEFIQKRWRIHLISEDVFNRGQSIEIGECVGLRRDGGGGERPVGKSSNEACDPRRRKDSMSELVSCCESHIILYISDIPAASLVRLLSSAGVDDRL